MKQVLQNNKISIIVPVYNVEKYIEECILSLINQTYENFEIILIDDGSTDNSLLICQKYAQKQKNIKMISQKNEGVSVARNEGLSNANGKWICFVDGDDYMEPNALSIMMNEVQKYNCDILITAPIMEYDKLSIKTPIFKNDIIFQEQKEELINNIICRQYKNKFKSDIGSGGPWGKLYKKEFLDNNHLQFIVGLKRMQDVMFNLYAVTYAKKIVYKNIYTYHYRINFGSSTIKYNPTIFETFNEVINIMLNYCQTINPQFYQAVYMKIVLMYIEGARIGIVNPNNFSSKKEQIKNLKEIYKTKNFKRGFKKVVMF